MRTREADESCSEGAGGEGPLGLADSGARPYRMRCTPQRTPLSRTGDPGIAPATANQRRSARGQRPRPSHPWPRSHRLADLPCVASRRARSITTSPTGVRTNRDRAADALTTADEAILIAQPRNGSTSLAPLPQGLTGRGRSAHQVATVDVQGRGLPAVDYHQARRYIHDVAAPRRRVQIVASGS